MSEMVRRVEMTLELVIDMSIGMSPKGRLELMARAAIAAMREPTDGMVREATRYRHTVTYSGTPIDCYLSHHGAVYIWNRQIDEALK